MKRAYTEVPEGQIHYQFGGGGPTLLLLHQTGFNSDEYWRMMPELSKTYRVVAMDTLGYGKSDKPPVGFKHEDYARTVVSFLSALAINRCNIVSHLTGAGIAVEVAAAHPELVDKLVLIDIPFYSPEMRIERQNRKDFKGWELKDDGSHISDYWKRFRGLTPKASAENLTTAVLSTLLAGPRSHDGHQALFRYIMETRLPLIKAPTLLISGSEAPIRERVDAALKMIPRCRLVKIEGGGDILPLERPEQCNKAILEFLANPGV